MSQKRLALYAFLLVAGLIGLAIDRMVAQPALSASVQDAMSTLVKASTVDRTEELLATGPPVASIFSSSRKPPASVGPLESFRGQMTVRDVFEMSQEMGRVYESKSQTTALAEQRRQQHEAEEKQQVLEAFDTAHQLKAVFIGPGATWAVVDDRIMTVGEALDGFVLVKVEPYRALFKRDDAFSELRLPDRDGSKVVPDSER